MHIQKKAKIITKKYVFLVLMALFLLYAAPPNSLFATAESSSGNDTVVVEPASKDFLTKFLNAGEQITGKITVSGGDNYITFKLFDPDGNFCLFMNILQSESFSWGPVELEGEYKLEFDNWFDSSSVNTVNLEFKIISSTDSSFPSTLVLVILAVIVAIAIAVAIVLHRRGEKNKSTSTIILAMNFFQI